MTANQTNSQTKKKTRTTAKDDGDYDEGDDGYSE
jgi:hypothetical protein